MEIKFKRLSEKAVTPVKATTGSAAFDLTCTDITTEINEAGELILVYHTGIAVEIPEGYYGMLCMRSSVFKKTLTMCNAVGIVDSDYRGEITGRFRSTVPVVPAVYKPQERFAQLLILPVEDVTFTEASELSITDRGENGYGSTGDAIVDTESAPTGSVESPAIEEEQAQETANEGSGGEQSIPEQA